MNRIKFHGEYIFSLFLVAGFFKTAVSFLFPVDLTLILLILTLVITGWRFVKGNLMIRVYTIKPLVVFFLFSVCVVISYLYTPSEVNANEKILRFFGITSWCFVGAVFFLKNEKSSNRFLNGLSAVSIVMSAAAIFQLILQGGSVGFTKVLGSNYTALAISGAIGGIFFFTKMVFNVGRKWLNASFALLCVVGMLISGARMPLLAFGLVVCLLPIFTLRFSDGTAYIKKKVLLLTATGCTLFLAVASFLWSRGYLDTIIMRFQVMIGNGGGESVSARFDRYKVAWLMIKENPLGNGLGSFPIKFWGQDINDYPHNWFLEIWSEIGIVGLIVYVALLLWAVYNGIIKYKKLHGSFESSQVAIILNFFILLLISTTSGSLNEKLIWAFMAAMIVSPYLRRRKESQ